MSDDTRVPITIVEVGRERVPALDAHLARHFAESGRDGAPFMPFDAATTTPGPVDASLLQRPLTEPGWLRVFAAVTVDGETVVGHVDLKSDGLHAGLHRCELGIGIEGPHRGGGLGRRLMQHAIDFARAAETLVWLDLKVFAHNAPARALYRNLGFREIGTVEDRFRLPGHVIDDVMMTLRVDGAGT